MRQALEFWKTRIAGIVPVQLEMEKAFSTWTAALSIPQSAKMVIKMDRVPSQQPVKDPPNLIRSGAFSLDCLLSHIDPGTDEESEEFVLGIYEQRHADLSSDRNKTGR